MGFRSPIAVSLGGCGSSWGCSTLSMELHPFHDRTSASASDSASTCDPDTAFSYLDEKLRVVLGDVQKEFEGGISADKSGSKFGGYGSFLPTYERRTPLVYLSQPKAPVTPTNDAVTGKVPPIEGLVGRMRRNEVAAVSSSFIKSEKLCGRVGASMAFDTNKSNSHPDNSEAMEDNLSTGHPNFETKKSLPVDHDQKRVTLRIKMGSNSDSRRKNSSIYNGFGLDNSSVSMEGDSDGDNNFHSELESSSPERSPLSMIQRITSHRIPRGGTLLTPLQDYHLLKLKERNRNAAFSSPIKAKQRKMTVKDIGHEKIDKLAEETEETLGEVKLGNVGRTECLKKNNKGDMDRSWKERKLNVSTKLSGKELASYADNSLEISQSNEKTSNPARVRIKEMASPVHLINYKLNEGKKSDSNRDVLEPSKPQRIQNQETIKASGSIYVGPNGKRVKECKEEKEGKKVLDAKGSSSVHIERKVDGVKIKVKASSSDYSGTDKALEPELSWGETRKKLKVSEKEAKWSKDLTKVKGKERKGEIIAKNHLNKDRKSDPLREGGKETFRAFCKNETKAEAVESSRKESRGKDVSYKGNPGLFETERDEGIQIAGEPISKAATTATGVLITEDWVECDKCKRWRLLPLGIKPEELPKKWRCKMLTWLQGMNSCKYTEEQTTQAVYALYATFPPPPPPPVLSVGAPNELLNCVKSESLNHRLESEKFEKSGMSKKTCKILLGSSAKSQIPTEERKLTSAEDDLGYLRVMEDKRKAKEKEKLKRLRAGEGDILQMPNKRLKAPSPQRSLDAADRDVASDQSGSIKKLKISHNLHERTNHDRLLEDSTRETGKSLCSDVGRIDRAVHDAKARKSDAASKCAPSQMNRKNGGLQESNDDRAVLSFDYAEGHNRHVNGKPKETNAICLDRFKDRDGRDGRYDRQYSLEKASREPGEEKKLNPDVDPLKRKDKRDGSKVLSHDKQEGESPTIRDGGHDQRQQMLSGVKKRKSESINEGRKTVIETIVDSQSRQELAVNRQSQISLSIAQAHNSNQREDRGQRLNSTKKNSEKSQNVTQSVVLNLRATVDHELCKTSKEQADWAMTSIKSSGVSNSHISREDTARIQSAANLVIQEAKDLKHCADRLKANGGTDMYFRACLKYLHGASMLEPINAESAKLGETTQSINVYKDTAKLCEFCASSYERTRELAAAALAYKCAGLAHMRVIMAKKTCASKDTSELVAAYHQLPPGESPSSLSSLDVDNLCHQEKVPSSAATRGGVASPVLPGNFIIAARNRPSYSRVLQYVSDVTSALEALEKSQNTYAMVDRSSTSAEGMQALKNVVDTSVDDVENLLWLVRLALEAIQE